MLARPEGEIGGPGTLCRISFPAPSPRQCSWLSATRAIRRPVPIKVEWFGLIRRVAGWPADRLARQDGAASDIEKVYGHIRRFNSLPAAQTTHSHRPQFEFSLGKNGRRIVIFYLPPLFSLCTTGRSGLDATCIHSMNFHRRSSKGPACPTIISSLLPLLRGFLH